MTLVHSPQIVARLLLYWTAIIATCWTLAFTCIWSFSAAYERYDKNAAKIVNFFIVDNDSPASDWSGNLLGFIMPLLLVACLSSLMLTNAILPHWRVSFINRGFVAVRRLIYAILSLCKLKSAEDAVRLNRRHLAEKEARNQFGLGDSNMNLLGMIFTVVPILFLFFWDLPEMMKSGDEYEEEYEGEDTENEDEGAKEVSKKGRLLMVSISAGWLGTFLLCFFLIPVSRHSVLLVAMNWSPVHALRIHVWFGYASFVMIFLHATTMFIFWFKYPEGKVYEEFIPPKRCWTAAEWVVGSRCEWQFYNFTGSLAFLFFLVLWVTSLHWFRRKYYKLFYIFHVVFGTLMMIGSVWHFQFIALYFAPGVLYYLASTMPTLIQSLASRFRGGVKITQVVRIKNAGDCLEVHIAASEHSSAILSDRRSCKYVKLCIPSISLVWHPFTVYNKANSDPQTLRFLFRPVGPFTRDLSSRLLAPERPITLIDGFYLVGDRCGDALSHDHVTIVAGGVAIVPFLSLIPTILHELSCNQQSLHSMEFIWVVREKGLKQYVFEKYIKGMMAVANTIEGFELKVKIFCTEATCNGPSDSSDNPSKEDNDVDDISKPVEKNEQSSKEEVMVHESFGHAMEIGRMMPARFSQIRWNAPYFLAFTLSVITGFHFLMFRYDYEATNLKSFSHQTWVFILVILFFIGCAVVIEAVVLIGSKYWPAPRLDSFDVVNVETVAFDQEKCVGDNAPAEMMSGRPATADIFNDRIKSSCFPGIIMCGPIAMTAMIKNEATKENSHLAYTRYVLYEETWEM